MHASTTRPARLPRRRIALVGLVLLAGAACSGTRARPLDLEEQSDRERRQLEASQARLLELVAERGTAEESEGYRLGTGDVVRVSVFEVPELDRETRIADDGTLEMPVAGKVPVAGRSPQAAERAIEERLASVVVDPEVTIHVLEYRSQRVQVLGAVRSPGVYTLSEGRSRIYDLIGEAGGVTPEAGALVHLYPAAALGTGASLERLEQEMQLGLVSEIPIADDAEPIAVRLRTVIGTGPAAQLLLADGDVLQVPRRGTYFVGGEVRQPGERPLSEGSSLLTAIAQAGGLGDYPIDDAVQLIRAEDGADQTYLLDYGSIVDGKAPDPPVLAGDKIIVPRDAFMAGVMGFVNTLGRFIGIGISPF